MNDKVIFDTLVCSSNTYIGRIKLNQEKALNALTLDMASAILQQLDLWRADDSIAAIFIEGAGERALCAGGDIKAMYYDMQKNPGDESKQTEAFFEREYRMDYTLHTYPKPVIAWGTGIVMGGGLGIFMGADIRIVSKKSRLAMPEITIGLYPDVGANYFLNQIPTEIGRCIALTGAIVNATDSLSLGLANGLLSHNQKDNFLETLKNIEWGDKATSIEHIQEHVNSLGKTEEADMPASEIDQAQDVITGIFTQKDSRTLIDDFLAEPTDNPWLQKAQQNLENGSPLSALIIDTQFKRAKHQSLKEVFETEMILSTNIVRFTELSEGVRALLIDKDKQPQWNFKSHHDVPDDVLESFFNPPWETNPLSDLAE